MNSQIANDIDQILTVLGKHFVRTPEPVESMGALRIIVIGASVLFVLWCMYKMSRNTVGYQSPYDDPRVHEAEVQELISQRKAMKARYDAEMDNIEAMYQAVVNPSQRTQLQSETPVNYGNPNRLPPPRRIGYRSGGYEPGWLYLIEGDNAYKIGITTNMEARFAKLQTGSPKKLTITHKVRTNNMRALEAELHRKYADKRLNGEWFALAPVDVAEICLIKDEVAA